MQRGNSWFTSNLVGHPVRNSAGETLGKVEELVVDPATGAVQFAVISLNGLMRDRYIAVPWSALEFAPGRDYVLLDMDKKCPGAGAIVYTWPVAQFFRSRLEVSRICLLRLCGSAAGSGADGRGP